MSQVIDWDVVKVHFIDGADRAMLATTIGVTESELLSVAEQRGWLVDAIAQKKQRVQERAALGDAETLDEAVHEDDLVIQAVTQNFRNIIHQVGALMPSTSSATQLAALAKANMDAYTGYKEIRGLSEGGEDDDRLLDPVKRIVERNKRTTETKRLERSRDS